MTSDSFFQLLWNILSFTIPSAYICLSNRFWFLTRVLITNQYRDTSVKYMNLTFTKIYDVYIRFQFCTILLSWQFKLQLCMVSIFVKKLNISIFFFKQLEMLLQNLKSLIWRIKSCLLCLQKQQPRIFFIHWLTILFATP